MPISNMRDRILAVIRGEPVDRVPFVQYDNIAAPNHVVWDRLGRDEVGVLRWTAPYRVEHPNCQTHVESVVLDGQNGRRTTIETPAGTICEESYLEPTFGTAARRRHYVECPDDYAALQAYFNDAVVLDEPGPFHKAQEELGENGLPLVRVDRTPFQQLWIQWTGILNLSVHLVDCPDRVAGVVEAMGRQQRAIFDVVCRLPLDFVDFPDNITAPVIGEANFRTYCVPYYNELAERLAESNVPVFVHMDGDLKSLWQEIDGSGVSGIDSLSPPPDNDTTVGDVVRLWPGMRIWVNFPSSVHLASPDEIYDHACEILDQGAHTGRLQIQISENMPPGAWEKSFPQIVKAIHDFGRN
jgi:hypothetical protein